MMYAFLILSFLFPLAMFWMPAKMKGQGMLTFVARRTVIVLPYLMWLVFFEPSIVQWRVTETLVLFSTLLVLVLVRKDEFLFKASKTYAGLAGPIDKKMFFASLYNLLIFLIGEEAFFRLGILSVSPTKTAVVLQALGFVFGHYLTPWGRSFRLEDLLRQFIFSLVAGLYFFATKDILVCVFSHLILNLPEFIHIFRRVQIKPSEHEIFCGDL